MRKYFAVTGGKEIVYSGALPSLRLATSRKLFPSSLASSVFSGLPKLAFIEPIQSNWGITNVRERIVCGESNSYRIHELSPSAEIGSLVDFIRSPSVSMAKSGEPLLALIFGCSDSMDTSLAGR